MLSQTYRLIFFRKFFLFTVLSKHLTHFSVYKTALSCKNVNRRDFRKIISLYPIHFCFVFIFQRLPRVILLLTDILKQTKKEKPDHPDIAQLESSLNKIKEVSIRSQVCTVKIWKKVLTKACTSSKTEIRIRQNRNLDFNLKCFFTQKTWKLR